MESKADREVFTQYQAHYKDEQHDMDLIIYNSEEKGKLSDLSFMIDGIWFIGSCQDDFELKNPEDYEKAKALFTIMKYGGINKEYHTNSPYYYLLQHYSMQLTMPLYVKRISDSSLLLGKLFLDYELIEHDQKKHQSRRSCDGVNIEIDDTNCNCFKLVIDHEEFFAEKKGLFFELSLLEINKQIKNKYEMVCCFSCQYSDYSPYGNGDYGTMLCYKRFKNEYLKVNDKSSYFNYVDGLSCDICQENSLCEEYEPRVKCEGYRGYV